MKWGAVGKRRLLKLTDHLERGKLGSTGYKDFVLDHFNVGERDKRGCGSAGCALGELPIVFPRLWRFDRSKGVLLRKGSLGSPFSDAVKFFGLPKVEVVALFSPYQQRSWDRGVLSSSSTPNQLSVSIRKFIPWKDKKEAAACLVVA